MESILQRKYYKLFTGTNQTGGTDKIYLGYEAKTTELTLKKGQTTYFHTPYFSNVQNISATSLGNDGALAGPIPALADRLFKKRGGYKNTTPWGQTTGKKDGTWLCSWYYGVSSETPMWLDRYYDPGRLTYEEALEGRANFTDYIQYNPMYYDVPSNLMLEPGALYAFYHHDEFAVKDIVDTFSGIDKTRLRLDVDDWSTDNLLTLDKSIYNNKVTIDEFTTNWVLSTQDPGYVDRYALSFDHSDFINCYITHDLNYNLKNEFTLSFWIGHKNWSNATSTQLIGNLKKGGYGVFYNNLNTNPYFVIPETRYGHLFYVNQNINVYTDKNIQTSLGEPANIIYVAVNSNSEILVVNATGSQIIKYNHIGDPITNLKNNIGENFVYEGIFVRLILDKDDNIILYTTSNTYIFDKDLILLSIESVTNSPYLQIAYDNNNNLITQLSGLDLKFDQFNNKWHIDLNKHLYKNNILISELSNYNCTHLAIDPEGVLWVLVENNKILKINPLTNNIISVFEVGIDDAQQRQKNISFVQIYARETNTFTWFAVIYYSLDKTLYQVSLDGRTIKTIYLPQQLNILDPVSTQHDVNLLEFNCPGDFTGYEHRRVFNKILYNNIPQIQFKVSVEPANRNLPNSIYTISVPANNLVDDIWHLITVTIKNSVIGLYIDNTLLGSIVVPRSSVIDYDFKNDLYIGCPTGKNSNLNSEINSNNIIWNGFIDSIKIYDYAIDPRFIRYFVLAKITFADIVWNIPTTPIQYIEGIDRVFKNRLPGHKSSFFNLKVVGTNIKDLPTRNRIERDLRLAIEQTKPGYSELLNIEWVE